MEQSPCSEADRSSASQETPHILCNPKVHHRIQNSPPPVSILSHIHPVHLYPSHFLEIHFNIILPSVSRFSKWFLPPRSPHPKPYMHLSCVPHVPHGPPISFFFISSPEYYLVSSKDVIGTIASQTLGSTMFSYLVCHCDRAVRWMYLENCSRQTGLLLSKHFQTKSSTKHTPATEISLKSDSSQ